MHHTPAGEEEARDPDALRCTINGTLEPGRCLGREDWREGVKSGGLSLGDCARFHGGAWF